MSLGKILACLMIYIFIDANLKEGNWQTMILSSAIIPAIVLFGCLTSILESPRFLVQVNRKEEAIQIIDLILKENVKN